MTTPADTSIVLNWVLGTLSVIGLGISTVIGVLWKKGENANALLLTNKDQTITSLREQVLGLQRERDKADEKAEDATRRYDRLKGEFKATVKALQAARVWADPGASVGLVHDLDESREPTGVFHVEAYHGRKLFLGEREEQERRRQRSLNPDAERRERERRDKAELDARLERYARGKDSSDPPSR